MKRILFLLAFISIVSCSSDDELIEEITDDTFFSYWNVSEVLVNDKTWGINNGYYFDIKKNGKIKLKDVIGEIELAFTWKRSDNGYNDSIITSDRNRCYQVWKRLNNYELEIQHTIMQKGKIVTFSYSSIKN